MTTLAEERERLARALPAPIWAAIADVVGDRAPGGLHVAQVPGSWLVVPVTELGAARTWTVGDTPVTIGVLELLLEAET